MASSSSNRKKAKHEANQEALDRLWEKHEQVSKQPNSKFVYTISKAIKSVQACTTAITTTKEAKALHGVGDSIARTIVKKAQDSLILSRESSVASTTIASAAATNSESATGAASKPLRRKDPPPPPPPDGKMEVSKPSEKKKAHEKAVRNSEMLVLPKDDWKVVLVIDGREHGWEKVLAKLQMSGVPTEKRHLPIGDMAWIAKSGDTEVLLGTIIERKAVSDLASSLFGTRYNEQRLRLQHCGLPQVFLLVEGDTKGVSNCPHDTLQMAMMETRVQLGFQVVQTRHLEDSIRFLKSVHRRILQRAFPSAFGGETTGASLPSFSSPSASRRRRRKSIKKRDKADRRSLEEMIFDVPPEPAFGASRFITYHELKCKIELDREEGTKTIRAIFCGMLKQIPRISNTTVPPLVHAFPTPDAMFRALDGLNEAEGKSLLADLETGTMRVGDKKALEIYHTFMAGGDDSILAETFPPVQVGTALPAIEEAAPNVVSKPNSSVEVNDAIELHHSPALSEEEVSPSCLSDNGWEKWELQEDGAAIQQTQNDTRQSLESIDSVDAMVKEFAKKKPTVEPIMVDSSSDDDSEYERKLPLARAALTKKCAPRQQHNPLKRNQASSGNNLTKPTCRFPITHALYCGNGDNKKTPSPACLPSPRKRPLLSSILAASSESEEEQPLNERIKRLREKFNSAKESLKSRPPERTFPREVSISDDEEDVVHSRSHQEVIELSD